MRRWGAQTVPETTMLRRSAAAEFASHCFPKAVVLTVPCNNLLWTETTSFPWQVVARHLGERPWSETSKSGLSGAPHSTLRNAAAVRQEQPATLALSPSSLAPSPFLPRKMGEGAKARNVALSPRAPDCASFSDH